MCRKVLEAEILYSHNLAYSTDEDRASSIVVGLLLNIGIFDRITLGRGSIVAEKYMVGSKFSKLCLKLSWVSMVFGQKYDPYIMHQKWYLDGKDTTLDSAMLLLKKEDIHSIIFNIDTLSKHSIDLREYDKNGINYSRD